MEEGIIGVGRHLSGRPPASGSECAKMFTHITLLQHDKQMFDLHTYEPPDFGGGYCGVVVQIHHPDEAATVLAVPDEVAVHPQPVVGSLVDGVVGPDVWSQPEAVDEVTPRASFSMLIVALVLQSRARPTQPQPQPAHDTIEGP
ncbi:hypothetical protein OsJ_06958 [Oryza sativa Japonica Group]|uniref:Uncharacterized protein n=1 Tax=Oryza sativa subsp. japonica TaxID=39947 RepID=B9F0B3_ORYSJ|nr:hypothetical protein OsJ_06958 [Oryza sativa Japonica Group]